MNDHDEDFELLDKALELASEKTLLWQYVPWVTPTTPLSVLDRVYITCTPEEFKAMKAKLGAEREDWCEVTGDLGPGERFGARRTVAGGHHGSRRPTACA